MPNLLHLATNPTPSSIPKHDVEEAVTTTSANKGGKIVLLQTARAIATNDQAKSLTRVRLLFDSGSQHLYVAEQVCSRLKM